MAYYISNIARSKGDPKVIRSGPSSMGAADRMAKALGWFSIGLGLTELIAAERITRALGMEGKEGLVRAYGVRELGHGIVSLSPDKHIGLWSRVAGDGLDIATLMTAMRHDNPKRDNVGIALAVLVGVTLLDFVSAQAVTARHSRRRGQPRSYRNRTGFPQGVQAARGAAKDFEAPPDMRAAPALAAVSNRAPQERARPH
jgi:hypothetical protein